MVEGENLETKIKFKGWGPGLGLVSSVVIDYIAMNCGIDTKYGCEQYLYDLTNPVFMMGIGYTIEKLCCGVNKGMKYITGDKRY